MTPKPTTPADRPALRFVIVTMDTHLASATERAKATLAREIPGLHLVVHAAAEWGRDTASLERCKRDIAQGDVILVSMLFLEEHFQPVLPALIARRDSCDAMICCMSAGEIVRLTRMGRFTMDGSGSGPLALLKRLRGRERNGERRGAGSGADQMRMLRRIPKILRFIPGTAQDVRAYFLTLQYWLGGSQDNIGNMVRFLVDRYAAGPRAGLRGTLEAGEPIQYPDVGVYHPRLKAKGGARIGDYAADIPAPEGFATPKGTVGLLLMRSYLLAGNAAHYDGVITALEAQGLAVLPCFATGLDARPAIERYFTRDGHATVDAIVSLTGFSLVGGPAYNDAKAAEDVLARLDVPYVAAHPVEFQTLEEWAASERGLSPVETTIMVAIPELDGATSPTLFGGRSDGTGVACKGCARACVFPTSASARDMHVCAERAATMAARVGRLIALRRSERAQRRLAIVLFNFPPNAGHTGSAAYLGVFESLHNTMKTLAAGGWTVEVPETVDDLRQRIVEGNRERTGALANVHERIAVDDHVRREVHLHEIEAQWGPAPGRHLTDGRSLFVMGERFGNVFVGVQPGFGYEGDPMRLMYEKDMAPTHAFSAFYRWLREDFGAHAVLHFGTHGALCFMPGKQTGMSARCWPDRLIGDLPHVYLYASNNPSEGTIAKRRSNATLVSYLTPPVAQAGLYRGLAELKSSLERWRGLPPGSPERRDLAELVQAQASIVELAMPAPAWPFDATIESRIQALGTALLELEYALIPDGLHVVGRGATNEERIETLAAMADAANTTSAAGNDHVTRRAVEALVAGATPSGALAEAGLGQLPHLLSRMESLADTDRLLAHDHELPALVHALDGGFTRPAPGGDLLRNPAVLPTGRNLHGFDPFRIPSAFALADGARQATRLIERHIAGGHPFPETIAFVLWGTDNLKSEGGPLSQCLALMGAKPRFDSYGRLAGAALIPLEELGRPRIDVVVTLSGIFRDLLPLQTRLLAEAAYLAATAEEPSERNFVRKHALAYRDEHGCDFETAALRVFGNAEGAYGSHVNHLIDNGRWSDEDELAEQYARRKCFAYGRSGRPEQHRDLLTSVLSRVELAYQNLDSVELGVTTIDNYFDTLGGISRAVRSARSAAGAAGAGGSAATTPPVYIGDQTTSDGLVRTLEEQVALETRTRMLNPKWYEGMLRHGYEGVRQIELHITNTMGWSATTGQVSPWVYKHLTDTFVLDAEMRERLAQLNPAASARVATRLLEASERHYWQPDEATLESLRDANAELEDRLEGVFPVAPLRAAA